MAKYTEQLGTSETRDKALAAFKRLRIEGYLARANYLCCSTCAGYGLAEKASELKDKGKSVAGVVFWHRQDEEHYWESGRLHIRYGSAETSKHGTIGFSSRLVGKRVEQLLREHGCIVRWDGDENRTIEVITPAAQEKEFSKAEVVDGWRD